MKHICYFCQACIDLFLLLSLDFLFKKLSHVQKICYFSHVADDDSFTNMLIYKHLFFVFSFFRKGWKG